MSDELLKAAIGFGFALVAAAISWLVASVLSAREKLLLASDQLKRLEAEMVAVKASQITIERVREVIENALEKREKVQEQRIAEQNRLRRLEMAEAIRGEMERLIPKIVREIRSSELPQTGE